MKRVYMTVIYWLSIFFLSFSSAVWADDGDCVDCDWMTVMNTCWIYPPSENMACFDNEFNTCFPDCCTESCYDEALLNCAITDPSENVECFEEQYDYCRQDCCMNACYDGLRFACEMRCEEYCHSNACASECEDEGSDECDQCMYTCMEGDEDEGCLGECESLSSECTDQCMNAPGDHDGDGINDDEDNCVTVSNPLQEDRDSDNVGDACDICPDNPDPGQEDSDNDCRGDACDPCPGVFSNRHDDNDHDGMGNACDNDIDGDTIDNIADNCIFVPNSDQSDVDNDGIGDACDTTDRQLTAGDYTVPDLVIKFAADIKLPETYAPSESLYTEPPPFMALAFDIFSDPTGTLIAGYFRPGNCSDVRTYAANGWILGYNGDSDNSTDDTVRFNIIPQSGNTIKTSIYGMTGKNTFVGKYIDESKTIRGFIGERYYYPDDGLWYYSFNSMEFPDANSTELWDMAFITSLDRYVSVGRYKDSQHIIHGFTYSRYLDGGTLTEHWTPVDVPNMDFTYLNGINSNGIMAGYCRAGTTTHGFYYDGTQFVVLDVPGASATYCYKINENDAITGYYKDSTGSHSFIYDISRATWRTFEIRNAKDTISFGINDSEEVVGYFVDSAGVHVFKTKSLSEFSSCPADLDFDNDVDGKDVYLMAVEYGNGQPVEHDLQDLADDLGTEMCSEIPH